jgi:AsmA protein
MLWRGEEVKFKGTIANPLALVSGGVSPLRFAIAATTLRASFEGDASSTAGSPRFAGRAAVATPSLRRTLGWLGTATDAGATFGAASVDGTVNLVGLTATFETATVELDGNRADGSLTIVVAGPRPAVQGTLRADRLDLTPYVEAARAGITADGPWPIAPTRLPLADAINVDVRFSVGEVVVAGAMHLGGTTATLSTTNGSVDIGFGEINIDGGMLTGRVGAAMVGEELVVRGEATMSGVPVRATLADLAGIEGLDGTASIEIDIAARGKSWGEFARSLAGTSTVAVTNGSIEGIEVPAIAATLADPLAEPIEPVGGTTSFSDLAATVTISGGVLSTENLFLRGAGFTARVSGTGSLLTRLVDAKAIVTAAGIDVPVTVTGGWRTPTIARDLERAPASEGAAAGAAPAGG